MKNDCLHGWLYVALLLAVTISYSGMVSSSRNSGGGESSVQRRSRLAVSPRALPAVAPMAWDIAEGAYMASLVVGQGVVQLVLDTGSSQLSVKGPGCKWRTCGPQGCTVGACPCGTLEGGGLRTDCEDYYYKPAGYKISPGEEGSGVNTVMTYGSQVDTIEHYMASVHVSVAKTAVACKDSFLAPY